METCLICNVVADLKASTGDFRHVVCRECGEYKMANTAVAVLAGRTISVADMRRWLDEQRKLGLGVPMIQSLNLKFA
jgi:hypothetical protein